MTEESNDIVAVDEKPEPEEPKTEEVPSETPEPKEEQKRVKIREVAKEKAECQDCKKTMCMKTLRYSHPTKCEEKPSDILQKPVRKNNLKPKIKVQNLAPEPEEDNEIFTNEPQQIQQQSKPLTKAIVPNVPTPKTTMRQPVNPYANLSQSQLLQLQLRSMNAEIQRRRQEKADKLGQAMFSSRSKKSK